MLKEWGLRGNETGGSFGAVECCVVLKQWRHEPGQFDLNKNRPSTHLRRGQKIPKVKKENLPRENNTHLVSMVGVTAILRCDVRLSDVTVTWIKHTTYGNESNMEVLSVNTSTIVEDKRFLVTNDIERKMWKLHIRYSQRKDVGRYECQVGYQPTFSIYVDLDLFEARAVILGPSIREVDRGFPIRLSCILNMTEHYKMYRIPPTYMFWYHGSRMINYDPKDGAVVREGRLGTELIFQRALPAHAGNYSCVPSNARQASVQVIVHYPGEQLPSASPLNQSSPSRFRPFLGLLLLSLMTVAVETSSVYR
ncbi:lachesin-like isoform X2 [Sitophilus oryzae]|uniref:Lachesin-like isoform X2 n=1 Tax=Sitophilus oryzae TaxID=7048 RepID=A0A6J2Y987_SITOR|nr:lachesin-like isoform X2 [Sitophilus oryzae]